MCLIMNRVKRSIFAVLILLISVFIPYMMLPKYKVQNSISNSNSYHGTRDTKLKVIVYHFWDYYNDGLMEQIYKEYMTVNDCMDTSLEINLYYSKWYHEPFKTETFYREQG